MRRWLPASFIAGAWLFSISACVGPNHKHGACNVGGSSG